MPRKFPIPPYDSKLKNPPYPEQVVEDLRERMREGPVTLGHEELERIIAMLEVLSRRCGAAYQIVGVLSGHAGLFHHPAVVKALDVLARPLIEGEILPFNPEPADGRRKKPLTKSKRVRKKKSRS
jgi:hypothetical protein